MAGRRPVLAQLRNEDYTDRELLHIVADLQAADGYVATAEIVERLGMPEGMNSVHAVASRMSWMTRYGWVERHPDIRGTWRLTRKGRALMAGELTPEMSEALAGMSHGDRVLVMREVARRSLVTTDGPTADLVRREYLHHFAARQRRFKARAS